MDLHHGNQTHSDLWLHGMLVKGIRYISWTELHRLACLAITGVMRTTPTAAMKVLLELLSLHMINVVEAKAVIHRLMCNHQQEPKSTNYGPAKKPWNMEHEPILLIGTDKMTIRYAYHKPFKIQLLERVHGKMGLAQIRKGAWSGIQMGPKPMKTLVLGCTDGAQKRALLQPLAPHHGTPNRNRRYQGLHNGEYRKRLQRQEHPRSLR